MARPWETDDNEVARERAIALMHGIMALIPDGERIDVALWAMATVSGNLLREIPDARAVARARGLINETIDIILDGSDDVVFKLLSPPGSPGRPH